MKYLPLLLLIPLAIWAADPAEPLSGSRVTIDQRHAKVHASEAFTVTYRNAVSNVGDRTSIVFKTPVNKRVHMFLGSYSDGSSKLYLDSDPSVFYAQETAHQLIPNRDRGSSSESLVSSYETAPTAGEVSVFDEVASLAAGIGTTPDETSYWAFITNDYVTMSHNAALTFPDGDWTIAGWVKIGSNVGSFYQGVFGWSTTGTTPSFNFYIREASLSSPNKLAITIVDNAGYARSFNTDGLPGASTSWQHITLTRDGANIKVYFNGIVDTNPLAVGSLVGVNANAPAIFGARGGVNNFLNGSLSEWAKWDRALTTGEITLLAGGSLPSEFPTDLKWHTRTTVQYDEEIVPLTVFNQGSAAAIRTRPLPDFLPYWAFEMADTQYVTMNDNAALTLPNGDWTIGGWVKFVDNAGTLYRGIIGWDAPAATPSFNLYILEESKASHPGELSVYLEDNAGTYAILTTDIVAGASTSWQHVVVTRDSDVLKMYVDGVLDTSPVSIGSLVGSDSAEALIFGARGNTQYFLNGCMSQWAKWDRALTQQEITDLATDALPSQVATPVWYTEMNTDYDELIVPLTVTNQGTTAVSPSGSPTLLRSSEGSNRAIQELIFEPDTVYVIYLESMVATDVAHGFKLDWYELEVNSTQWYEE